MLKPTLGEIVADPTIYRHYRKQEMSFATGRGGEFIGRKIVTPFVIGWRWFLARGPWDVRPVWLRVVWWTVPLVFGLWLFGFHVIGWLSMYFWLPNVAGWIWEKRINAYAARSAKKAQYDEIEQEIAERQSPAGPNRPHHQYQDPNRLKS